MKKNILYYLTPVLAAILIFASNFLNTDIFNIGFQNFTVWFVLSLFTFACGWLMDQTFGWVKGGKLLFAVIVVAAFFGIVLVSFFREYFGLNDLLSETLILYTLRNVTLGTMGFFGMAISRLLIYEKQLEANKKILEDYEDKVPLAEREAEIVLKEAKLKAEELLLETQKKCNELIESKNKIDRQLSELIKTEEELLKQYESNEE
ncbi:MAG: hypothetical protein HND52_15775 [Ignavibacteriae bacterium]|nr:hypothetical protein [Ignavibacteriota bacterium]NOG99414.1 hypothetical protein [Ignavibacteriota bacterium]